jgi:hypothetical protein
MSNVNLLDRKIERDLDGTRTDWKGLSQYLRDLFYGDEATRAYALREVGRLPLEVNDTMHVNVGGSWKEITDPQVNVSDTWKEINEGWENVSGTWKQFYGRSSIPDDLIGLSGQAISATGWSEITATYSGYWLRVGSTYGSTGGANTHGHTNSNDGGITTSGSQAAPVSTVPSVWGSRAHTHPTKYHTHSAVNSYPARKNMRGWISSGTAIFPQNMFCFWNGNSGTIPTGFTYVAANGYYIRFTTGGTGSLNAASYNSHSSGTIYTGYRTPSNIACGPSGPSPQYVYYPTNHRHTCIHSHSHSITLSYLRLVLMYASSDQSEFPAGCVLPAQTVPADGWTDLTSTYSGRFPQCYSTALGTAGTTSHNHTHSGTTGTATNSSASNLNATLVVTSPHNHTISNAKTHSTQNHIPQYVDMKLIRKD